MSEAKRILIVDDEPLNVELMEEILEDGYKVTSVLSGDECLSQVLDLKPDLILLDVAMPNMDGYEVCRRLKNELDIQTPILFVSARGSLEDRITGYDAGGDDYLVKPFDNQELLAKIKSMEGYINARLNLKKDLTEAQNMISMVMTDSSELGNVTLFMRQSFNCKSYKALIKLLLDAVRHFGLNCTAQVTTKSGRITMDSHGAYKPVEAELLEMTKNKGRIFEYGKRMVINFNSISLLVKNMPLEDSDRCGRLRDHLCLVMEGAEAKVLALYYENQVAKREKELSELLVDTQKSINDIDEKLKHEKLVAVELSQDLILKLSEEIMLLALDEDQEKSVIKLVENGMASVIQAFDSREEIEQYFKQIISNIRATTMS